MVERRTVLRRVLGTLLSGGTAAALLLGPLAASADAQSAGARQTGGVAANAPSLFMILYRPGGAWRAGAPVEQQDLRAHGRYMQGLLDSGRLFAAGALMDEAAGGLVILNVATLGEARAIMSADPAVIDGVLAGEVRPWRPRFYSDRALSLPAQ